MHSKVQQPVDLRVLGSDKGPNKERIDTICMMHASSFLQKLVRFAVSSFIVPRRFVRLVLTFLSFSTLAEDLIRQVFFEGDSMLITAYHRHTTE
jgi:hypothetical protein